MRGFLTIKPKQTLLYFTLLFLFFFISRVTYINTQDVFFDSGEYKKIFATQDFFQALTLGHFPIHEGYIILFWPIFQIAKLFTSNSAYVVIIGQIIFAFLTLYCFYFVVQTIIDKRTAIVASALISLTPLYWITNVTIMMETAYISFFFFSLIFLAKYTPKKPLYLYLSFIFLGLAVNTHTLVAIWLPLYWYLAYLQHKKIINKILLMTVVTLIIFALIKVIAISILMNMSVSDVVLFLYLSKGSEMAYLPMSIKGLLIAARNTFLPLLRSNTIIVCLLAFIALVRSYRNDKSVFILGVLWTAPALYANQWWDSLLNGRHALIAGFGVAYLCAYLIKRKLFITVIVFFTVLATSLPALSLLQKNIPYVEQASLAASLPKDSLLIESHFARPQVKEMFHGKLIIVNEPSWGKEHLAETINKYLHTNKPVFVTSAALSEPYGLYTGPYLHTITLSYAGEFELKQIMEQFTLKPYKILSVQDNLIIYQIVSANSSSYPQVKNMKYTQRRIDYNDPVWKVGHRLKIF